MKFVCAPDSFKESLTAAAAARAMAAGVRSALPDAEVDACPVSDGGEGFVDAMLAAMNGRAMRSEVTGPLGERREAAWGLIAGGEGGAATAVMEMAAAAGLELVPQDRRDPMKTTTFGLGGLICEAVGAHHCRRVLIGIGGSATNDAGCGMAQALGVVFIDGGGKPIDGLMCGGLLERVARIDVSGVPAAVRDAEFVVACDVTNPLTGPDGAAHVYAPQKGASAEQVERLDAGLRHIARLWREQLGVDVEHEPGAGAAGGLGGGLRAFATATLRPGVDLVLDAVRFDQRVAGAELVLTGEGRLDGQSLSGKACLGVARAAKRRGVATVALVGALGPDAERALEAGLADYRAISEGLTAQESIRRAAELLEVAAREVVQSRTNPLPLGEGGERSSPVEGSAQRLDE